MWLIGRNGRPIEDTSVPYGRRELTTEARRLGEEMAEMCAGFLERNPTHISAIGIRSGIGVCGASENPPSSSSPPHCSGKCEIGNQ